MAVATIVLAGAVVLSGCGPAPDVVGVDSSSTTDSTATTTAPETTTTPTTAAASPDPATLVIDRLLGAFNAQDAEGVAGVFGDGVVYVLRDRDQEMVGADIAAFFKSYFGVETGERIAGAFPAPDGRTYFLAEFTTARGSSTVVFDVEMDGERLISMGDRPQKFDEIVATLEVDDLYEAFNDQDVDRLTERFEAMTYTSPSGVEFTGAEAAEHWADGFGLSLARTSGVFAIGEGVYGFVTEYREADSGSSTAYVVEVEMSGGQVTSVTERLPAT